MENLIDLVNALRKYPNETSWIEFKHNNYDFKMIGQDISALANSATLSERNKSYMLWGIDDKTHEIIGTKEDLQTLKRGNQELESWLRMMLSKNAEFEIKKLEVEGLSICILIISKAMYQPVTFEKTEYIRIGSYTVKLSDHPNLKVQLWDKLRNEKFETQSTFIDLELTKALQMLDYTSYFDIKGIPMPTDESGIAHYMLEQQIIQKQDNEKYSITNLGGIALAKDLATFNRIGRKAIRIVLYDGINRLSMLKDETINKGYVSGFNEALKLIEALLPSKEVINTAFRETELQYPPLAIRESLANALIHQDFSITGAGPTVEIFSNRIEITNPGRLLVDKYRIIDNPPKSRNEKLATLMRQLKLCEELGTGWDKITLACEKALLPAPQITQYEDNVKVSLFSKIPYQNMAKEDRLWACYLHACIRHAQGQYLSNSSLRERFGVAPSTAGSISRLIKEAVSQSLIKPLDENMSNKQMKYIPIWA